MILEILPGSFFENSTSFADLIGRILDGHIGHRIWQFSFPSQTYFSLITESSIFSGIRESAFDISPKKSRKIKERFQTLFRKSVKCWNFDKMFGASYFSSKITSVANICAAYNLRGRRYWQKYS